MLNGEDHVRVRTTLPFEKVLDKVEEILGELGDISIESNGDFTIDGRRFNNFALETKLDGWVEQRKSGKEYEVTVKYTMSPAVGGIILAVVFLIFFAPLVLIPVLMGINAQSELKKRLRRTLEDLEDELDRDA
jgi:hypothetical protein